MIVLLGYGHLGKPDDVSSTGLELAPRLHLIPQTLGFLAKPLGSLGILPDGWVF
jgi:hypothetical protein